MSISRCRSRYEAELAVSVCPLFQAQWDEHYRTDLGLIFPPEEKIVSLCQRILLYQHSQFVIARQFSQLLGFLNSLAEVVPLGHLHIRPLQFYLLQH
jgi:hypothetical protein